MDSPPGRIGQYTVVDLLGEGGSGKVYLAEQTEPLRRTVALKVLESIGGSERSLARFEIERLALAVMDHPSVAKVYDAGITDDGHPYVVMERVDGVPIVQYCDAQKLTIRQRVELFGEACRAVHHAHQKGVIHRDLKPSHILITEDEGRPRLRIIDFGIAVALERGGGLDVGRDEREVVGTPGYMSPEQMEGSGDIDTRSDIYSLGVILYELLVGVPPFEFGRRRGWAAVAAQLEDLPTPTRRLVSLDDTQDTVASHRRTTPRGLRRALHGDLDTIVTRAMSKNRDNRYDTARDLWLDLERYLKFEPVEARSGGPVYRSRKFMRRHRVGVAFGTVVAVGLLSVGATTALQARRVAQARDEALLRRSQAEALIDFMLTDLRDRLRPIGRLDVLDAVGEQAMEYLAATPERFITDEELFRRVAALQLIGGVRVSQGDLPDALRVFEGALTLNSDLAARSPENAEWQVALGASHFYVGDIALRTGDLDTALDHFERYLAISERLVEGDPENVEWLTELAYSHSNIGSVEERLGHLDAALGRFGDALEIFRRVADAVPEDGDRQLDLADTYNTVGNILLMQGRLAEASESFTEELLIKETLVERDPTNATWTERFATGHNYLAQALVLAGHPDSAMVHFRRAAGVWAALVELDSTNVQWRRNLAMNRQWVAKGLIDRGELTGALDLLAGVVATLRDLVATDPTDPGWKRDLALSYRDMATLLHGLGRPSEALATVQDAQGILDTLIEASPGNRDLYRRRGESYNVEALIRTNRGERDLARGAWERAAETLESVAEGSSDVRYVAPWAHALLHLDRIEEARLLLRRLEETGYRDDELATLAENRGLSTALRRRPVQ